MTTFSARYEVWEDGYIDGDDYLPVYFYVVRNRETNKDERIFFFDILGTKAPDGTDAKRKAERWAHLRELLRATP